MATTTEPRKYLTILLFSICFLPAAVFGQTGNVGIGTTSPKARLHVTDSNVMFTGIYPVPSSTNFGPSASGAGTRLLWYPQKGAFRVGSVIGTNWNKDSIGQLSFASGHNCKASGTYSSAMGYYAIASGWGSTAIGVNTIASESNSTAMGISTIASGGSSTAMGYGSIASGAISTATGTGSIASGNISTAMGNGSMASGEVATAMGHTTNAAGYVSTALGANTIASGAWSTAMGNFTKATGDGSTAMGSATNATGTSSTAMGSYTKARSDYSLAIGTYNDTSSTNRLFEIGYGLSDFLRMNAVTVLKSGQMGLGTTTPLARLHVADSNVLFTGTYPVPVSTSFGPSASGAGTRMLWYPQKAAFRTGTVTGTQWDKDSIGRFSFASGYNTKAPGESSTAIGYYAIASFNFSTAMGAYTTASGNTSTAMGSDSKASGIISTAMGYYTIASGDYSTAMGAFTTASGNYSTTMGARCVASAPYSTSMGAYSSASGNASTAMGAYSIASGANAIAAGNNAVASGSPSVALGYYTLASGDRSTALGDATAALAYGSTTMGFHTKAKSDNSLVIGLWNDTTATNRLFEIGNGSADNARNNALTVLDNGNTGIGIINPPFSLTVKGDINVDALGANDGGSANSLRFGLSSGEYIASKRTSGGNQFALDFYTNYARRISISNNGNVGIGTDAPAQKLQVAGNICASGAIGSCSDIRYKNGFEPLSNSLENVLAIKGFYYYWNREQFPEMQFTKERQLGFAAQDVEIFYPEVVMTDANGYKSVDYGRLTPVLFEAIKELAIRNAKLEAQILGMKKLMEKLMK